jgi:hypothetical protein
MNPSPDQPSSGRGAAGTPRAPRSFFYDRVVPALIGGLVIVLLIVLVLASGALVGVIPTQ